MLKITPLLDRMPQGLSGGEQQRVVIGRAAVSRHPVWLLDEPLAHLDPATRLAVRDELLLLQDVLLPTIIEVTHDPIEARSLGRRVAVLNNGRLEQVGTPAEVYARPQSRSAATSLGWPPMNFIDGSLAAPDAGAPARSFRLHGEGRAVVLGVRAEDVGAGPAPEGAADLGEWIEGRVEEHGVGSLRLMRRDGPVVRRWAAPGEPAGAKPRLWVAADRCHWFDPADGTRITDWE
jgi:ABC-type sugar transport system ATPase subunit